MKKQLIDRELVQARICENTYEAMKKLIENSLYSQLTRTEDNAINYLSYLKEYCTVRIGTSRQSGHSTAMCRVIKEYFNRAIILSPNQSMSVRRNELFRKVYGPPSQEFRTLSKNEISTQNDMFLFGSWQSSLANNFCCYEVEAVFIDGTFGMSNSKEDEIYMTLGSSSYMKNNPQKLFAFIQ